MIDAAIWWGGVNGGYHAQLVRESLHDAFRGLGIYYRSSFDIWEPDGVFRGGR